MPFLKVVIAVEEFDPNKGYLEYYLARELTKLGHRVHIFTYGWTKHPSKVFSDEGFEVVSIPHIATINGIHVPSLSGLINVIKFVKEEKPDIIHCQPLNSPLSLVFIALRHLSNHKIVGSLITGEYSINSPLARIKYLLMEAITERYVSRRSDSIFAINDGWKKVTLNLYNIPEQKISLIPLGADPEHFKFDIKARTGIRKQLELSPEDVVVVYSGRITQSKQLDLLLEAISPLIAQNRKLKLLIVGKGKQTYVEHLKKLCYKMGISDKVIFHPWVHRTKLPAFYSASDIAVWPGSISISIIEAASVGLPVIIRKSSTTKYTTVYQNGVTFERGNLKELRAHLRTLAENSELRRQMGHQARLLVEQKLNWATIANQYLNAYAGNSARVSSLTNGSMKLTR